MAGQTQEQDRPDYRHDGCHTTDQRPRVIAENGNLEGGVDICRPDKEQQDEAQWRTKQRADAGLQIRALDARWRLDRNFSGTFLGRLLLFFRFDKLIDKWLGLRILAKLFEGGFRKIRPAHAGTK